MKMWNLPQLIAQNQSANDNLGCTYQMDIQREDDFPRSVSLSKAACYQLTDKGFLTALLLKQVKECLEKLVVV